MVRLWVSLTIVSISLPADSTGKCGRANGGAAPLPSGSANVGREVDEVYDPALGSSESRWPIEGNAGRLEKRPSRVTNPGKSLNDNGKEPRPETRDDQPTDINRRL